MADPTLRLTFDDLRIRVAEFLGIAYLGAAGNEAAQVPVDAHDLDLVTRIVNDGYHRFLTENERGWNFLTVPLTITFGTGTVSGDLSRYYAPDDFYGLIVSPFTFAASAGLPPIQQVSDQELRESQIVSATGFPVMFATRAINTVETTTAQRWEFIFWPTPSGTQVVTGMYKRFPAKMTTGTNVPVSGFQHDRTVLASALAAAELHRHDSIGPKEQAYTRELAKSRKIDARASSPRSLDFGDKSEDRGGGFRHKSFYGVDTYNGNSIL